MGNISILPTRKYIIVVGNYLQVNAIELYLKWRKEKKKTNILGIIGGPDSIDNP